MGVMTLGFGLILLVAQLLAPALGKQAVMDWMPKKGQKQPDYKADYRAEHGYYHNYSYFEEKLRVLVERNPDLVTLNPPEPRIEQVSREGRPLHFIKLTSPRTRAKREKIKFLITFGEHARELITVENVLDLIKNLTESYRLPCDHPAGVLARYLLNHMELHMLPLCNPDGKVRMERSKDYCWRTLSNGVDPNRNAEWEFGGPGSSFDMKSEEYNGGKPWSEPETRFLRDVVLAHKYYAMVSVHSGEQQLFVPFVDTKSKKIKRKRPTTHEELAMILRVQDKMSGWFHDSGIGYEKNSYGADGCFYDWAAGVAHIPYVFLVEIWGHVQWDSCFCQFNPKAEELQNDLQRMRPFFYYILLEVLEKWTGRSLDVWALHNSKPRELAHLCSLQQSLSEHRSNFITHDSREGVSLLARLHPNDN
eukprot:gb/GEZN01007558.1/.p1 GENE.gb/GEZN01007558.1/~~gb/GEZN01007558.1/.p1  ORF type:complete len:420 (+),score=70.10 gb/GEZN01007558.1/:156-1415(+)